MPLKVHNGTTFIEPKVKVHNGTSFIDLEYGKVYNGSTWVTFYTGPANIPITISNWSVGNDTGVASIQYNIDGSVWNEDGIPLENWTTMPLHRASYEIRATKTTGTNPTGDALATWLSLENVRYWTLTDSDPGAAGSKSCTLTIEIRYAPTQVVRDTATVTLTASWIEGGGGGGGGGGGEVP